MAAEPWLIWATAKDAADLVPQDWDRPPPPPKRGWRPEPRPMPDTLGISRRMDPPGMPVPESHTLPDAFGAAVERWIEGHVRGGPLEPHMIELREALPHLYDELVETLFASPPEDAA